MAQLTQDPFIIDINLLSSIDLQKYLSDYINTLTAFPEETALNSLYWHMDSHSDPITSKIDFFKRLNSGEIVLKSNPDGVEKLQTNPADLRNKNIRDQLPDNYHMSTETGGLYGEPKISGTAVDYIEKRYTKEWSPLLDGTDHANSNAEWVVKPLNSDPKKREIEKPADGHYEPVVLPEKFGMKEMSSWFIAWWLEKFYTSHKIVKEQLIELLGEENEYFVDFSESVGQLKNLAMYEDTSTLPMYDDQVEAIPDHSIPSIASSVALYCVSEDSKLMISDMSKYTNQVFRSNMKQMIEDPSRDETITNMLMPLDSSTTSHGQNFVGDWSHNTRMINFIETVQTAIQEHLRGLYGVLELISNRENLMVQGKPKEILMKVEEFTHSVDLFKNKIKDYTLSVNETTKSTFGKPTNFSHNYTNAEFLAIPGVEEV